MRGVAIDPAIDPVNTYPIAVVAGSDESALAQEFIDLVLGENQGQRVLGEAGFGRP